jgi:uncharacterized protein YukE
MLINREKIVINYTVSKATARPFRVTRQVVDTIVSPVEQSNPFSKETWQGMVSTAYHAWYSQNTRLSDACDML